jgi:hypothetical protein
MQCMERRSDYAVHGPTETFVLPGARLHLQAGAQRSAAVDGVQSRECPEGEGEV